MSVEEVIHVCTGKEPHTHDDPTPPPPSLNPVPLSPENTEKDISIIRTT